MAGFQGLQASAAGNPVVDNEALYLRFAEQNASLSTVKV
jgi:hypothetical protein